MSADSRSERERLKEEYKAHYRKMREDKERLSRAKKTRNISEALASMDKSSMLAAFDDVLTSVKHKVASVEARLDLAMESLADSEEPSAEAELDEEMKKVQAKETLKQVKIEMGLLYKEIEQQADSIHVEKTIGTGTAPKRGDDKDGPADSMDQNR